jgi:hypothetical protein
MTVSMLASPSASVKAQEDTSAGNGSHAVDIRSTDSKTDQSLRDHEKTIDLDSPIVFYFVPSEGSDAEKYEYEIVRDGEKVSGSQKAESVSKVRLRLQPKSSSRPGLLNGRVTLRVWGIDENGDRSDPVTQDLLVQGAEEDNTQ